MSQVRLDDDVATLVKARAKKEGGGSMASVVNRLLFEALGRSPETADSAKRQKPAKVEVVPKPARRATRKPASPTARVAPDRVHATRAVGSVAPAAKPSAAAGAGAPARAASAPSCPHPLLRRVGDRCARCGEPV